MGTAREGRTRLPGHPTGQTERRRSPVAKYPFLSEEWIAEVRRLGDEARADGGGAHMPHPQKMNQVITEGPFGSGTIEAHMDTSSGEMNMEMGHLPDPDLTVTLDYATAK